MKGMEKLANTRGVSESRLQARGRGLTFFLTFGRDCEPKDLFFKSKGVKRSHFLFSIAIDFFNVDIQLRQRPH